MRTRMYGGVTGKASDGLPMSIQPSLTPKAFANPSPELERSDNPGISQKKDS